MINVTELQQSIKTAAVTGKLDKQPTSDTRFLTPIIEEEHFLPAGWKVAKLEDLCTYIQRGRMPKYCDDSPYYAVSQKCVQWSGFDLSRTRPYDPEAFEKLGDERWLRPGDILWNSTGTGTAGRCAILSEDDVPAPGVMAADSQVTVIRCGDQLLPDYLYLYISSPLIQDMIDNLISGATNQKHLNLGPIKALDVPLPPLDVQRELAEIAGHVDELVALESEREDLDKWFVQKMESSILAKVKAGDLVDFPDLKHGEVGDYFSLKAGKSIKASEISSQGTYPCYGGNGIRGFVEQYNFEGTYPLIGRQGALCGNLQMARGKFYATEHAVTVKCHEGINVDWAFWALKALNLNQYATATAQPGLAVRNIVKVPLICPSPEAQARTAQLCNQLFESLSAIELVLVQ